ncbi:MAG: Smr/MutS family protein [Pedobacter sp.]
MARKKKQQKSTREFKESPFKTLKGLVLSGQATSSVKKIEKKPEVEEEVDDSSLFEREMTMLNVEKRHGSEVGRPLPPESQESEPTPVHNPTPVTDQELFLSALGSMDSVFRDELPQEEEPHASPRRMKQLRQGKLAPEAQLDLHGATREEARQKVGYFLEDCVYQGYKTVLVITGRGKGSLEGPVLRDDMEKYLSHDASAWVVEWGRAPARYGGDGALVVYLRSSLKK